MNAVQEEMRNFCIMPVTCMYINSLYNTFNILSVIFRQDGNQVSKMASFSSVTESIAGKRRFCQHARQTQGQEWGLSTSQKSLFMVSADWCIPVGPAHLLLWRERSDFGVIIRTIPLPNIFNQPSVLCGISKVEWCSVPLMPYTFAVLVKSHWFFQSVHTVSGIEKTVESLFLPTCSLDGSDV